MEISKLVATPLAPNGKNDVESDAPKLDSEISSLHRSSAGTLFYMGHGTGDAATLYVVCVVQTNTVFVVRNEYCGTCVAREIWSRSIFGAMFRRRDAWSSTLSVVGW